MSFFHLNIFLFNKFTKLSRLIFLCICLVILFFFSLNNLYAQERVDIKGFETDLFSRLVFNWENPVEYQTTIIGKEVIIKFSRPGLIEEKKN